MPRGVKSGSLEPGGRTLSLSGSGYPDRNWGIASIIEQMHDWNRGRAAAGPYTAIASFIASSAPKEERR